MKTFEGIITRAQRHDSVCVEFRDGNRIELLAGAAVREQAEALLGRRVRFQAQLHESTLSLSSPIFVVGSQFGLQALAGERRQDCAFGPPPGGAPGGADEVYAELRREAAE